jgi:uncharacterized protein (TIGR02001 family)
MLSKKHLGWSAALLMSSLGMASAADLTMPVKAPPAVPAPTPPWDVAFGGAVMSDYNFRGISQSDRGIAGTFYVEGRLNLAPNWQLYAGIQPWTTKLPTTPIGEFDFYGGIRPTFGPFAFDFGAIYYYYPNESQVFVLPDAGPVGFGTPTTQPALNPAYVPWTTPNTDFWEVYGKVTWTVNDWLALGAAVYYSPNWLLTGADGTYAGVNVKVTAPSAWFPTDWGAYLSGEVDRYWLGTTNSVASVGVNLPDYTYWNLGVAFTYKVFTLDLRYHDTDVNRAQCFLLTGDLNGLDTGAHPGLSNWCGSAFIAKFSVDTTLMALK